MITTYGRDTAVASTLFYREAAPGKVGRQMQTWIRFPEGLENRRGPCQHHRRTGDPKSMSLDDLPRSRCRRRAGMRCRRVDRPSPQQSQDHARRGAAPAARRRDRARRAAAGLGARRNRHRAPLQRLAHAGARGAAPALPRAAWSKRAPIAAPWWRGPRSNGSPACSRRWRSWRRCAPALPPSG